MCPDVEGTSQLMDMIRATALTDYIKYEDETQDLQLINPGGFFQKYTMPAALPSAIVTGDTLPLEKGLYKGILFDIPGAEVLIDGEWLAYDAKNKDRIQKQNPMDLAWRLNGDLLRKLGYTPGQTIEGRLVAVNDQWLSLRLDVPFTVQLQ